MKIRKYTRRKKIWALFLFILCVSITLAGGLGLYYVNNFSDYLFSKKELLSSGKFENTETLEREILNDTQSIFEYAALASLFNEQDEFNREIPIYVARINGTAYNLCLEDLENIYERISNINGLETDYRSLDQEYLDQYADLYAEIYGNTDEWYSMAAEEKEALIKENRWEDYYEDSEWPVRIGLNSTAEILIYPGQTIYLMHDYLQQKDISESIDFMSLYDRASSLLSRYYELKNGLEGEETNLRYILYEKSSGIYETNDQTAAGGDMDLVSSVEENIRGFEKYISYDNTTHRIRSNFVKTDIKYWNLDYLAQSLVGVDSGVSFTVGLDTRYSVQDDYKIMSDGFLRCRPILMLSLPAIVLGMMGSIVAFIYLLASVGHREDYDEIWLDKFDRWPTEPAACLILGGIVAFIAVCGLLARVLAQNFFTSTLIYTVMQAISIIVSGIIGLIGFFSLVKRLKAGVVWKNSLLRRICKRVAGWFRILIRNWPTSGKAAGIIFLYWLITIPLCMFITINRFWGSSFLYFTGIIVFVGVQLAAAGVILWAVIQRKKILEGVEKISAGDLEYVIDDEGMYYDDKKLVDCINHIGAGLQDAVNTAVQSERMKADLITNVSHDIKTPLTSIINYVDLMKRENIEDETLKRYLDVLEQKSQRLKTLTEDLVEASRASSGNINLQLERINFVELVRQACGEFEEKFAERNLNQVISLPDHSLYVIVDGRRVWRILENLFQNAKKYAMPGTRIYVSVAEQDGFACFVMKNISESPLNIAADELMERFTRGDASRTTEGSGLGLSIAKSLTEVQDGIFDIYLNGDLFQATVQFELAEDEPELEEAEVLYESEGMDDISGETVGEAGPGVSDMGEREEAGTDLIGIMSDKEQMDEELLLKEALEELTSSGLLRDDRRL